MGLLSFVACESTSSSGRELTTLAPGSPKVAHNFYIFPADMEFVKKFTPPDFQAKIFTPSISPNFTQFQQF